MLSLLHLRDEYLITATLHFQPVNPDIGLMVTLNVRAADVVAPGLSDLSLRQMNMHESQKNKHVKSINKNRATVLMSACM